MSLPIDLAIFAAVLVVYIGGLAVLDTLRSAA